MDECIVKPARLAVLADHLDRRLRLRSVARQVMHRVAEEKNGAFHAPALLALEINP